jgi:hypothetical protein
MLASPDKMKRVRAAALAFVMSFLPSGCGDHLGAYRIIDVRVVRQFPEGDEIDTPSPPYPEYLRIELSSETNLNAMDTGAGLYVHADFCPRPGLDRMIAFGPLASDQGPVENWRRAQALTQDPRDGRYHYFIYLVPSSPPRRRFTNSSDVLPGYDLRVARRDLCLRLYVPGYNIIPSRSNVVRIRAATLRGALGAR